MKRIELKKIGMTNFKGARNVEILFNGDTNIYGDNGTGKSTIFDAFTWLLFGKNADDKKDFSIKTYDENGETIPRIPHEVSAVILVDGKEVCLRRVLEEKWTKKRGTATEEFTGNTEKRFWDEVPCNVSEWNTKVAELIPEQTFKTITNPLYFTSLKQDVQRNILMNMAGEISERELIGDNQQFGQIISECGGKTVEEYKRQIQAKKRIVKEAIESIPSRIDEVSRSIVEVSMTDADIEKELGDIAYEDKRIDSIIASDESALKESQERINKVNQDLSVIYGKIASRTLDIRSKLTEDYFKKLKKKDEVGAMINAYHEKVATIKQQNTQMASSIREAESALTSLREKFVSVRAEKIEFNDKDFVCPTCKRPLEVSEIERKQAEMTQNFNEDKAARLNQINESGKVTKGKIEDLKNKMAANDAEAEKVGAEIANLKVEFNSINPVNMTDEAIEKVVNEDQDVIDLLQQAELKKQELSSVGNVSKSYDEKDIAERRAMLRQRERVANGARYDRQSNEKAERRIAELEKELRANNEELARLEGIEFTIQNLQKRKVELVESRISSFFKIVRWKMFDTQINGGEVECCIPMIDGIPYADSNKTGKMHAGIDILNAMSKQMGVSAPVFIDNAESYNTLPECDSQIIRLIVSNDQQITIK